MKGGGKGSGKKQLPKRKGEFKGLLEESLGQWENFNVGQYLRAKK